MLLPGRRLWQVERETASHKNSISGSWLTCEHNAGLIHIAGVEIDWAGSPWINAPS